MYNREVIEKLKQQGVNTDEAISRFMGKEELFLSFIFRFTKNADFKEIRKCLEEKDEEQFYLHVHNLKGVSGNLGIETLSKCAYEILAEFRTSKFEQMEKLIRLVNEAECESDRIIEILASYEKEEN